MVAVAHLAVDADAHSKRLTRSLLALTLTNAEVRAANQNVESRVVETLEALVRAGQNSGEFRADVSPRLFVEFLGSVYFAALVGWAKTDAEEDLHQIVERTFALVWSGLRPL